MALTTLTVGELFAEIADLAREQGVAEQGAWNELVDEVVDSYLELGELDKDQDTEGMQEILRAKWKEFKSGAAAEDAGALEEGGISEQTDAFGQTRDSTLDDGGSI